MNTSATTAQLRRRPLYDGWTVRAGAGPVPPGMPDEIPARVPGVVHTDLLREGLIADPFDGDNESAQQWIGDTDWYYRTIFDWSDDGSSRHDLVAEGLDTVATVRLNGYEIGRTENQHRIYRFDLRGRLVDGANELEVGFAAPVPETERRAARFGALPRVNHHEFNQLRKTASHFGWDWGIDVAGSGIWRPIALESWTGHRIASVRPLVDVVDGIGILTVHVELERDDGAAAPVEVTATVDGRTGTAIVDAGETRATIEVQVPGVDLWWPVGHGGQTLYDVEVAVGEAQWAGRVGFRTVAVDVAPDDAGRPFRIQVNGRTVLVRGVNWVPDHAFLPEVDRARLSRRFDDMVEGNVNLVRVWGGGIYESEDFYDLADERGVLVWQDFLFACAAYSEEEHLAGEVEAEAREQITRLAPHPSLVVWNGCNENIWAYADWGWPVRLEDRTWGDGYYQKLLPALVAELDPTRFYSPGSPYSFGEYLHPNDPRNGTMHIWDVWNQRDYTAYRDYRPRFVSEFGFQGPPAWSTLTRTVHDEPLDPFGPQMLVHQKANLGNQKLARGAAGHLPPTSSIEDWHWAMQLNQAHAVRFGVEHFRSLTPHNTGMILWQLNDDWPVVSWAAVDFDGHRKPLWHAMRAAYAPQLATLQPRPSATALHSAFPGTTPEDDVLALVLVNDTPIPYEGDWRVERRNLHGTVLASVDLHAEVPPNTAATFEVPEDVGSFRDARRELVVASPADTASGFAQAILDGGEVTDQDLDPMPLTVRTEPAPGGYRMQVTARSYARDVMVLVDRVDERASIDRGLVSLPAGDSAEFFIRSDRSVSPEEWTTRFVLRTANELT